MNENLVDEAISETDQPTNYQLFGLGVFALLFTQAFAYTTKQLTKDALVLIDVGKQYFFGIQEGVYLITFIATLLLVAKFIVDRKYLSVKLVKRAALILLLAYISLEAFQYAYVLSMDKLYSLEFAERRIEYLRYANANPFLPNIHLLLILLTYCLFYLLFIKSIPRNTRY